MSARDRAAPAAPAVTVDYDTLDGDKKGTVTIRDRDTTEQKRIRMDDAPAIIDDLLTGRKAFADL